jgi:hypothetical protein
MPPRKKPTKAPASAPRFMATGGSHAGSTFIGLDPRHVRVIEPSKDERTYEFYASQWWPLSEDKRAPYAVNMTSTLHKLLTRASVLAQEKNRPRGGG